jgi:hypothetical protein
MKRDLVRMIAFISSWVTHTLLITLKYRLYSAITVLHTLQVTVAHALAFPVSRSSFPATDLNTENIIVSHYKYYTQISSSVHT